MAKEHISYPENFTDFYSEEQITSVKTIIDWLNVNAKRSQSHLAKQINYTAGSISTLINGKHKVDPAPIINDIIPIIEDKVEPVKLGEFIPTSTYRLIKLACDKARASGRFTIIAGSPGVGKTISLTQYVKELPSTIYLCGSEFTNSTTILDELITALNIKVSPTNRKSHKASLIIERLKGSKRLIILDEADKCTKDAIDPLRTISERSGCGIALAGNHQLRTTMIVGNNRYDLISDRVVFWPNLIEAISLDDCKSLLRPYIKDLTMVDEFDVLAEYAHKVTKGSARKLVNALIPNVIELYKSHELQKKDPRISCVWFQSIAITWMGVQNPPPLPVSRRSTAAI